MKFLRRTHMLALALGFWTALGGGASCSPSERAAQAASTVLPSTPAPGAPRRALLTVRETAGIARAGEVAQSGVPLPRSVGVRDPRTLAVVDAAGKTVPADFRVLARWNAGLGSDAPIQWLLVAFPATVEARGSAAYHLVLDGSAGPNPPPPLPLSLTRDGGQVVVDTGVAVFRLGKDPASLFDEVRLKDGGRLAGGGDMTLATRGSSGRHTAVRNVRIEHAGPLTAAVVVDGAYDMPQVGGGGFGSRRRYVFTAGSPTALVRQAVAWEGNLGCRGCTVTEDKQPNGVRIERVRDTLDLAPGDGKPLTATAVGAFAGAPVVQPVGRQESTAVRQLLRPERQAPARFTVEGPGGKTQGKTADGAMLAASGAAGTVAIALRQMHRYEPQALRLLPGGRLAVDLADDRAWLAHHQALFATLAVSALPGQAARADLDRRVWAPLNRPLRPWPEAGWFNASEAVEELPVGPLPQDLAAYDEAVSSLLRGTLDRIEPEGIPGLMTFGLYPRYWGRWGSKELQCTGNSDPTPKEAWDDTFWCGTWTDYHNTLATAPVWAMRTGEVEWLDDLAVPGALRMLHTQVMQCGPGEAWFYCGQAPAGYGGYRIDFNSSHAYWDNLFLYYWLTGDSLVVDTLRRGGENMRRFLCETRGPQPVTAAVDGPAGPDGPACAATHPPGAPAVAFSGRVASQWIAAFRFLGLASEDASFLEDYRSGLARALTQHYVEVERNGKRYGFLGGRVKEGGTLEAGPIWMNAFYDAENLHRFQLDTGDEAIGDPPLRPSRVLAALARTLVDLEAHALGKKGGRGEIKDPWPQNLDLVWQGARIGGSLVRLTPKDRNLFGPEKAGMAALLARAGKATGDPELIAAGREMVRFALGASRGEGVPLGKLQGQYLARLHSAVAVLAEPDDRKDEAKETGRR